MPGSKLRYRDALGGWSAPANNPGLKYYDAKAQWSVPSKNPKLKYRDALGQWSAPAVEAPSIGDMSWEALSALANAAAANPEGYRQYVGEYRYAHLMPMDVSAACVLVGVGGDTTQYGGRTGFTFWVKDISSFSKIDFTFEDLSKPYSEGAQAKYLDAMSIEGCPDSLLVPHRVGLWYGHDGPETEEGFSYYSETYHRFSPMASVNVHDTNYGGDEWDSPGELYYYFDPDGLNNDLRQDMPYDFWTGRGNAALLDVDWDEAVYKPETGEAPYPDWYYHEGRYVKHEVDTSADFSAWVISKGSENLMYTTAKFCLGSYEG